MQPSPLSTHNKPTTPSPNPSQNYLHLGYSLALRPGREEIGPMGVGEVFVKASLKSVSRAPISQRGSWAPSGPPSHPLLAQVVEAYSGRASREDIQRERQLCPARPADCPAPHTGLPTGRGQRCELQRVSLCCTLVLSLWEQRKPRWERLVPREHSRPRSSQANSPTENKQTNKQTNKLQRGKGELENGFADRER